MKKKRKPQLLRRLPSIDKVMHSPAIELLVAAHGRQLVTYAVRGAVAGVRELMGENRSVTEDPLPAILKETEKTVVSIALPSLKPVINATGVVLHTNLGRAPMGERVLEDIAPLVRGYSNLEFDLVRASRGHRGDHVAGLLKYLTGAEDAVVVNNNAAALILALHTFAKGKQVVISRGELIEIGGAFRIPEIMAAAGAKMAEVGTTNRTRLADYEKALSPKTAMIVKAHTSNYSISGFTEEVSVADLAGFARKKGLPFVYDIGSGLLRKPRGMIALDEPDVQTAVACGVDLITFSCDKLLGGPQAGVVAGRADLVRMLARAPLMRALRVGKLTLAALSSVCRRYCEGKDLAAVNPVFSLLERSLDERRRLAHRLLDAFAGLGIDAEVVASSLQAGGGTLPGLKLESTAVRLIPPSTSTARQRGRFAEELFRSLLRGERPVLGVLREGVLLFDCGTVFENEIPLIASAVSACLGSRASL